MLDSNAVPDYVLAEFLEVKTEINILEKRLEFMKDNLKKFGSFSTLNYVCAITTQVRQQIKPLSELMDLIGLDTIKDLKLINVHTFEVIKVAKKEIVSQQEPLFK